MFDNNWHLLKKDLSRAQASGYFYLDQWGASMTGISPIGDSQNEASYFFAVDYYVDNEFSLI